MLNKLLELITNCNIRSKDVVEGNIVENNHYRIVFSTDGEFAYLRGLKRPYTTLVEVSIPDNGVPLKMLFYPLKHRFVKELKVKIADEALRQLEEEKALAERVALRKTKRGRPSKTATTPKVEKPKVEKVTPEDVQIKPDEAIRHNDGKIRYDLIPSCFLKEVAQVFTFGAMKYSENNWQGFNEKQQGEINASLLRHIHAYLDGEVNDAESGLPHLAHAAANLAFISYFRNQKERK